MPTPQDVSRRTILKSTAALTATLVAGFPSFAAKGSSRLKVGVIGCGGRGTGAADNILEASKDVEIVALADVFPDRLEGCRNQLPKLPEGRGDRAKVPTDRCFTGFDAYKQLLATDVDLVILATPPHFRPLHLAAAIAAGKHVFMEKPVAVDPAGIRSVIASAQAAKAKNLSLVCGTQRRHEQCYLECLARLQDGAIGPITSAQVYWNQSGLWMNERQAAWSDMEWQLRNWLYFAWLSGDHIVEQHVHNLDAMNWVMGSHPIKASGMGGRQVRTSPAYGHAFDHFAIEYEYEDGRIGTSQCRQIDGCASRVEEVFHGTMGTCRTTSGQARIASKNKDASWTFSGENRNPYVQEHVDMLKGIMGNQPLNEGQRIAESTLTAIMGRMAAYTGQVVTWDFAMNKSKLDLTPEKYGMGSVAVPEIAMPGRTKLV